jgi:methionyl-tRNA synthetase
VLARHMRQRGEDVFFLTGTDEHGEPVALAAEREGIPPKELADRNAPRFQAMGERVGASNDFFIRTSDPRHAAKVAEVMQRVHDNGHVYEGVYEGWYCPRCADFKTERELGPGNTCPIHEIPLEREREENWFFRLSTFEDDLRQLYAEQPDFVVPDSRRNEALSFIERGLEDVSLSRPKLEWGMPLPWDPSQRMYVWFDALLNYYTALSFARDGEDLTDRFWPANRHVLGKDILKFHAVIWPALLIAAGIEPPRGMVIHGFLLMGEKKMSKSLGNVLDPNEAVERFGADPLRFYCCREVSFGQDGNVSAAGFEARYESELANDWGNLASRTLAMIDRYRDGVVPDAEPDPEMASGENRRRRPRAARPSRAHPGAGGDLGARQAAEPLRRGVAPVGPGEGRLAGGAPGFRPLQPGRGRPGARPAAARLHARDQRPAPRRARGGQSRARRVRRPRRRADNRADPPAVSEAPVTRR